jgi:hypothetical protein
MQRFEVTAWIPVEINQQTSLLEDLQARTEALRGYL